ncbi:MAG TPA: type II toxin-antitoxin system RelE/ParE family toxin [Pseudobdellovibrionaceae bacterium]|mgnify:CR=1 FL=1|nr:type II toxin-antitoxin system RelE/ParE family toxin [Pseudobdellovibrionaceae bacterium]
MPNHASAPTKRIHAIFYASESGLEPVKESLLELGRPTKTVVGEDIRFVELNWRVDRPYVDRLRTGRGEFEETLYEVRHKVGHVAYRTLFFVFGSQMILVHFFRKTSRKARKSDLDLGWQRMKLWIRAERESRRPTQKGDRREKKG